MDDPTPKLPGEDALNAFVLRYIQAPQKSRYVRVADEHHEDFLAVFGLLQRVRRLAKGYIRLRSGGLGPEGQILVRAALEHAITAQWAYLTIDGIDRLRVSASHHNYTVIHTIYSTSSNPESEAIIAEAAAARLLGSGMPKTAEIIREFDTDTHFLTQTYKVLSQMVHVTHRASVDAFELVDGEIRLRPAPDDDMEHEVLYALAAACMLSAWIIAHMAEDDDELSRLRGLGWDLNLISRMDFQLPEDKRRFND